MPQEDARNECVVGSSVDDGKSGRTGRAMKGSRDILVVAGVGGSGHRAKESLL